MSKTYSESDVNRIITARARATLTWEEWAKQITSKLDMHEKWIHTLFERLGNLEEQVRALQIPTLKEKMVEYLSEHSSATERELCELGGKDMRVASYYAFEQLKVKLNAEHHGSGRPMTYRLK